MLTESWVEGKSVEEKDAQPTERSAALWGLSSKIDSIIWLNFTRNGLRLGSRHQEPPHIDVSRNLGTVVIRGVLPGLRRRRTGLLLSGPKSSFQMRASFVFNLETKVLESGGRMEKLIAQVAWSPVLSFHSLWWFGGGHFMLPFIFQQDLASAHTAKSIKSWLNDHGVGVLDWPANSPDLNPIDNGVLSRGKWETRDQKMQMSWRPLSKKPGLPYHLSSATNWSPPCHAELRQQLKQKEPYQVLSTYTVNEHTFQKANNLLNIYFYWSYEVF